MTDFIINIGNEIKLRLFWIATSLATQAPRNDDVGGFGTEIFTPSLRDDVGGFGTETFHTIIARQCW